MAGNGERTSVGDEGYRLLARGEDFRVGLSRECREETAEEETIEVLVRLFPAGERIRPEDVEGALELVKKLDGMGYSVFFQDDGWISCERPVPADGAENEAGRLRALLESRKL